MPYLILFFAILFFMAAWQNKVSTLTGYLDRDLPPYGKFALAIAVLWVIGLAPQARKPTIALMFLVVLSIVLTNSSEFFSNLQNIGSGVQPLPASPTPADTIQPGNSNGGASTPGFGSVAPSVSLPFSIPGLGGLGL